MPGAKTVEVSGDFTLWKPVRLMASPGRGMASVASDGARNPSGQLRVNGGKWIVPPGLTPITDEFGGAVGLLVVE